jgi:uncharacterized membrane protein
VVCSKQLCLEVKNPAGALLWLERRAPLFAALFFVAVIIILQIPARIQQDTFLALVDGRYVAHYGIPHHDIFTVIAHGANWVD